MSEQAFVVDNIEKVEWFLRTRAAKTDEIKRIQEQAAAMVKELQNEVDSLDYLYSEQVQGVVRANLKEGRKSVKTLHGTVQFRTIPETFKITDSLQFSGCLPDVQELMRLDIAEVRRAYTVLHGELVKKETGEVITAQGIEFVESREEVYYK